MALFPITGRFVGDFIPHLVAVDTDDTMADVAEKVATLSVGHRVPMPTDPPGYEVLLDDVVIPESTVFGAVVAEHDLMPLQWFDVRFRERASVAT
ncbi:MAG: toluene-4-monooxygenase system B family protein [Actinomycetota bacterium]|nr:toluene-4-monooxygenase system B family protein [Actinomycetota bacterium]MDP1877311.1 toluene-4-monooxygenase system B family protein [Actinomycetota bacterium]